MSWPRTGPATSAPSGASWPVADTPLMRPAGRADAARVKRALLLTLLVLLALPSAARAAACTPQPGSPTCAAWTGKAAFVDDGDTIDVDVAGDGTAHPVRVRPIGIQ